MQPGAPAVVHAVRDGSDPEDTGCARLPGVQLLDATEVDYAGAPVGLAQLKYSPQCGAAWPRFEPFAKGDLPKGAVVHVDVVRPDDGGRFPFHYAYVGAVIFGNQAVSTSRCVYAAVWVERAGEDVHESRTHCFRGSTYIR